eukprot:jgi/Tetstr1/444375/TSEL_032265.t2
MLPVMGDSSRLSESASMEAGELAPRAGAEPGDASGSYSAAFRRTDSEEECSSIQEPSYENDSYWTVHEAGFPEMPPVQGEPEEGGRGEGGGEQEESRWEQGDGSADSSWEEQPERGAEPSGGTLNETTGEPPVLLITTVDIGEGRSDRIEVRAGENTTDAARRFCAKHGLPDAVVEPLSRHLIDNLSSLARTQGVSDKPSRMPKMRSSAPTRRPSGHAPADPFERLYRSHTGARRTSESHTWMPQYHPGGRARGNGQVFDRLYAQAEATRSKKEALAVKHEEDVRAQIESQRENISWVSRELTAGRTAGEYMNYGERLYVEGVVERERKQREAQLMKQEETAHELRGATFQPRISKMAQQIHRPKEMSTWERLSVGYSNQKPMLAARMQMMRLEDAAKEVKECTFAPAINKQSKRMMSQRTEVLREHRITAHEQLFQDAIRRQLRQDEYNEWYPEDVTFQPAVNPPEAWKRASVAASRASVSSVRSSRQPLVQREAMPNGTVGVGVWAGAQSSGQGDAAAEEGGAAPPSAAKSAASSAGGFGDRLYALKDEKGKKAAAMAASIQPKFKPNTGRGPKGQHRGRQSIGDYLYSKHHEIESKKEYLTEQHRQLQEQQSRQPHTSSHSQSLMTKLKKRRFQQIFAFLDQDNSNAVDLVGLVVSNGDFLNQLQADARDDVVEAARLLQARRDAFAKRCQQDNSISKDEVPEVLLVDVEGFAALMEEVLRAHRGHPRAYLQPASVSSRMDVPEYNFQPELARKSKALAAKRRPKNVPAYEIMLQEHQQAQHRRELKKAAAEDAELAECTFEPHFVSIPLAQTGRVVPHSDTSSTPSSAIHVPNEARRRLLQSELKLANSTPGRTQTPLSSATASLFELAGMTHDSTAVGDSTSAEHSHDLLLQLEAVARASEDPHYGQHYEYADAPAEEEPRQRGSGVVPTLLQAELEDGLQARNVFTSSYAFGADSGSVPQQTAGSWPLEQVIDTDSEDEGHSLSPGLQGWTPLSEQHPHRSGALPTPSRYS